MRVIEQQSWPSSQPLGNFAAEIQKTPRFVMADGSVVATRFRNTYVAGDAESQRWVVSAGFIRYKRLGAGLGEMYMPDGTVAYYNAQGHLESFRDGFNNWVTLDRLSVPGAIIVTQQLGNNQSRVVQWTLNGAGQVTGMTYDGRDWEYEYQNSQLVRVSPPFGPDWTFGYTNNLLSTVTTPSGGQITYGYVDQHYNWGSIKVLQTRSTSGPGVTPGTWQFDWTPGYTETERLTPVTEITMPSGRTLRYENFSGPSAGTLVLGGGTGHLAMILSGADGQWVEREERQYLSLGIKHNDANGPAELSQSHVRRRHPPTGTERTRTMAISYQEAPIGGHWNYHQPWTITETSSDGAPTRQTTYAYVHREGNGSEPYLVGLRTSETTTVNGQVTVNRTAQYSLSVWPQWRHPFWSSDGSATTTYEPDAFGNVAKATTEGKETTYAYDWAQLDSTNAPEPGLELDRTINPDGTVASETAGGLTTTFGYNYQAGVFTVQGPNGIPVVTTYDGVTARTVTTQRGTLSATTHLDGFGRPIESIDGSGVRTRTLYDAEGRVTYRSLPFTPGAPEGNADIGFFVTYDALDRVLRETHTNGAYTERTYGLNTTKVRDEAGRETTYTEGPFGITHVADAAGKNWSYGYNTTWGQLESISGPIGDTTPAVTRSWTYDADGRLATEQSPEAGTVTYSQYDDLGLLLQKTDANGTEFVYTYDDNHRLETITATTSAPETTMSTTLTYEPGSDRVKTMVTDPDTSAPGDDVQTELSYDAAGRPWRRTDTIAGTAFVAEYAFDAQDQLTTITYPSGRQVKYDYDQHGRLSRVYNASTGLNYATSFVYHGSGALKGFTSGNGIPTSFTLDPQRYRVSGITSGALQLSYTYDAVGNVLTIGDSRPGKSQTYTYDALDRLATFDGFETSTTFAYDAHGNRDRPGYEYDSATLRLESVGSTDYQYDPNGNFTGVLDVLTYQYRPDNMMRRAESPAGTTNYFYDAEAARVKKSTVGGATVYFVRGPDGQLLAEWTNVSPTSATSREYLYAGSRLLGLVTKTGLPPK